MLVEKLQDKILIILFVKGTVLCVIGFACGDLGDFCCHEQVWVAPFDEFFPAEQSGGFLRNGFLLLNLVQGDDYLESEIFLFDENLAVIFIDQLAKDSHIDMIGVMKIIFRQWEKAPTLFEKHAPDAHAHGVNHVQMNHGLGQKGIAIALRRSSSQYVIFNGAVIKSTDILQNEPIAFFDQDNPGILSVVLMGNTVFLCFQIRSLDAARFPKHPAGNISGELMGKIEETVRYCLDL